MLIAYDIAQRCFTKVRMRHILTYNRENYYRANSELYTDTSQCPPTQSIQGPMQWSTPCLMLTAYDIAQRCFTIKYGCVIFWFTIEETIFGLILSCTHLLASAHPHHVLKDPCSQTHLDKDAHHSCTLPTTNPYVAVTQAPANAVKYTVLYFE